MLNIIFVPQTLQLHFHLHFPAFPCEKEFLKGKYASEGFHMFDRHSVNASDLLKLGEFSEVD